MKIAILTNFTEFMPGYSLTGIVKDQAAMLTKYGHEVDLFVNSAYNGETFPADVTLQKKIPFSHLTDYHSKNDITAEDKMMVKQIAGVFREELHKYEIVFTHDFVFTGWNMIYALALQESANDTRDVRFLHWIHSIPTSMYDWWRIRDYGVNHKLVYPNETDRLRVAEAYQGEMADVRVIHHIKDLRTWFDFEDQTVEFIDDFPAIMQADFVQVYPASSDRLSAKRVDVVMRILAGLKKRGHSVMLVIANQWATGKQPKENINRYRQIGSRCGLKVNEDFTFSSEWKKDVELGLPKRMLRELLLCSNLFIFPTKDETFGLVLPEASLTGGCICVLNRSLQMMYEVAGYTGLYFNFGSFDHTHNIENEKKYYEDIAMIIEGRFREDDALRTKTHMRKRYNMDALYKREYSPVFGDSMTWM